CRSLSPSFQGTGSLKVGGRYPRQRERRGSHRWMWEKLLLGKGWPWLGVALVLVACLRSSPAPRGPASPFAELLGQFPYRPPPTRSKPGHLADIVAAPAGQSAKRRTSAPMAFTRSAAGGLGVRRPAARVAIGSMLAFAELRLSFFSPEARVRAGRFTLRRPAGAALSRLAMKVGGDWQEAEVVEQ